MRKYGQHFLVDTRIRDSILEAAGVTPQDLVLEVGPGCGVLTELLAQKAGLLVAVEIDEELASGLKAQFADCCSVQVVNADIMSCDIPQLIDDAVRQIAPSSIARCIVVSNLPYCISTPVMRKLLTVSRLISSYVIMVQLEVARKLTAAPGDEFYCPLSCEAQYYTYPEILFHVPPSAFRPNPAVQSSVVRMISRPIPPVTVEPEVLFDLIRAAFGVRRKSLRKSLTNAQMFGGRQDAVDAALAASGVDGSKRAEDVSVDDFAAIAHEALRLKVGDV